jgi:trypsin
MRVHGVSLVVVCASLLAACAPDVPDDAGKTTEEIVRGKEEKKLPQVVFVRVNGFNGFTLCTGTYFSSRVVVTAAHCRRFDAIPGQTFVYYGKDYFTDVATLPNIPAPGQPSVWARVETMAVHPDYNPAVNYPDLATLHLDRELPFAPIPLLRSPVTSADKKGDIAGWGGSKALTADITVVEGVGIKRSAKVKILGSPTEADFHADDPNPGILDPAIRANLLKTDGLRPSANTCAGDSGGPLLVKRNGRDYLAGVGFWTGLFCEDYAIFTRIDPFLAYFDDAVARAGQAPIIPRLECVEDQGAGAFRAQFGYRNDNALTVNIPYGSRNSLPGDNAQARPTAFRPGDYAFDFAVPFTSGQTLSWTLVPPGGPSTVVQASAASPICDPNNSTFQCARACDASLGAVCADPNASRPNCISSCVDDAFFFAEYLGCNSEWNAYIGCFANVSPAAENWDCSTPGFPPQLQPPNCDAELGALFTCIGY